MDRQQIFNKVAQHLLDQNKKSAQGEDCHYRSGGGLNLSCAVGCLITDEFYHDDLEGESADAMVVREAVSASIGQPISAVDAKLLCDLQDTHDYVSVDSWEEKLEEVAQQYFEKDLADILES